MNRYRILADACHDLAFLTLFYKLLTTKSAAGVSGRTQILYAIVFCTRYLDLFTFVGKTYDIVFKIFYLSMTFLFLFLVFYVFKNTYEKKYDTVRIEFIIIPCLIGGFLMYGFAYDSVMVNITESLWCSSLFLEVFAAVPQLLFVCKARRFEKYMLPYVVLMFSYRILYIFNWIDRLYYENFRNDVLYRCALVQAVIYVSFFIYFSCYVQGKTQIDYYSSNITEFSPSPANKKLLQEKPGSEIPSVYVIGTGKDYAVPNIGFTNENIK